MGTLLYYARAVDVTILVTLGTISSKQANATQTTSKCVNQLLDYCRTHPNAKLCYHASDMILHIHSDDSYNSEAKARSRAGGHFYLGNTSYVRPTMHSNEAILNTSTIMRNVMASASEAECGALFNNTKEDVSLRTTLHKIWRWSGLQWPVVLRSFPGPLTLLHPLLRHSKVECPQFSGCI